MSFSLLSVAILLLYATISGIEIYKGVKRGFMGALISLGTVVSSLIVTLSFAPLIVNVAVRFILKIVIKLTPFYSAYKSLIDKFTSLEELIIGVVSMLLSILGFLFFFVVFKILFKILFNFIHKVTLKRRKDDMGYCSEKNAFLYRHDKLMGGIVGAITAVILMMTLISPFMGTLEVLDKTCEIVDVFGEDTWKKIHLKKDEVKVVRRYYRDIPGSVFYHLGGKYMFRAMSSTIMYKERVYLFEELDAVHNVVLNLSESYKTITAPGEATPEDAEKVRALGESVSELKMVRGLFAEVLSKGAHAWRTGGKVMGVSLPELPSLIQKPFDEMLMVCEETNKDSVKYNVVTLFNLFAIVIDTDLIHTDFNDFETAFSFINETNLLTRVNDELAKNRYTKHIRVTSITMSAVASQLNSRNLTPEQYDNLSNGLADMINQINGMNYTSTDDKAGVLKDSAKKYVEDAMGEDADVPDEVIEAVAIELIEELEGKEKVTADDIKHVFDKYSE